MNVMNYYRTKVKAALDLYKIDHMDDADWAGIGPDMAQALITETERREKVEAENAVLREMQGLPPLGTYPEGELKRRMEAKVDRRERIERAAGELADVCDELMGLFPDQRLHLESALDAFRAAMEE
jgi:hypothetical protein